MNEKPVPPEDWQCCESQCSPCVWDTYNEALKQWQAQQAVAKAETKEVNVEPKDD